MPAALGVGALLCGAPASALEHLITHEPLPATVPFHGCFESASRAYGIPARLLAAVGRVESAFNPQAVSPKNAIGVMQIRWPVTARHLGVERREALFDACTSIDLGARYLSELRDEFGAWEKTLAAYNMGPMRIRSSAGRALPAAGREYVDLVTRALSRLAGTRIAEPASAGQAVLVFVVASAEQAGTTVETLRRLRPDAWTQVRATAAGWEVAVGR
jgi:hypothetical protein